MPIVMGPVSWQGPVRQPHEGIEDDEIDCAIAESGLTKKHTRTLSDEFSWRGPWMPHDGPALNQSRNLMPV